MYVADNAVAVAVDIASDGAKADGRVNAFCDIVYDFVVNVLKLLLLLLIMYLKLLMLMLMLLRLRLL